MFRNRAAVMRELALNAPHSETIPLLGLTSPVGCWNMTIDGTEKPSAQLIFFHGPKPPARFPNIRETEIISATYPATVERGLEDQAAGCVKKAPPSACVCEPRLEYENRQRRLVHAVPKGVGVADKGRNLSIEIRHHAVLTTDKISFKLRKRGRTPHSKEKMLGAVWKLQTH